MGSYSVGSGDIGAHAKTLVANTADTVTFAEDLAFVEVVSDGTAEVYVTVDKAAPTVGDEAAYYLPEVPCSRVIPAPARGGGTVVRLISSGTPKYSVAKGSEG